MLKNTLTTTETYKNNLYSRQMDIWSVIVGKYYKKQVERILIQFVRARKG